MIFAPTFAVWKKLTSNYVHKGKMKVRETIDVSSDLEPGRTLYGRKGRVRPSFVPRPEEEEEKGCLQSHTGDCMTSLFTISNQCRL